jgi:1-acyl-sn-glycerol-3-phosphate acyltransferase
MPVFPRARGVTLAALRRGWRLPAACVLLLGGLVTVLLVFPLMRAERRDATVAAWSRLLLRACGMRLVVDPAFGAPPLAGRGGGRMLVANHVSWVDIFAINAIAPSCFIAKADIARWPLIGTLVGRVGTLFLERGRRHAVHDALHKVASLLAQGRRIAVFPEGTTGDGLALLPFHANLVQAAVQARVPIDPVGIRYAGLRGEPVSGPGGAMDYVGEVTFVESLWRIIGAPGIVATLRPLPELPVEAAPTNRSRHERAQAARTAISRALDLPLEDNLPEVVRALRAARP